MDYHNVKWTDYEYKIIDKRTINNNIRQLFVPIFCNITVINSDKQFADFGQLDDTLLLSIKIPVGV